jgi:hypothetical protein
MLTDKHDGGLGSGYLNLRRQRKNSKQQMKEQHVAFLREYGLGASQIRGQCDPEPHRTIAEAADLPFV